MDHSRVRTKVAWSTDELKGVELGTMPRVTELAGRKLS